MNPSKNTASETLDSDPKNYEADNIVEDTIRPPIEKLVPPGLIPTTASPISKNTRAAIRKMKQVATLEAAAAQESDLEKLAEQFTRDSARENHQKNLAAAIEAGDASLIATLPSEVEQIEKYLQAYKTIQERLRRLRQSVAKELEGVALKAAETILEERAEAEAALVELFKKRGLTEPPVSIIGDPYTRRCQELRNYSQTFSAGGAALGRVLVELIG